MDDNDRPSGRSRRIRRYHPYKVSQVEEDYFAVIRTLRSTVIDKDNKRLFIVVLQSCLIARIKANTTCFPIRLECLEQLVKKKNWQTLIKYFLLKLMKRIRLLNGLLLRSRNIIFLGKTNRGE